MSNIFSYIFKIFLYYLCNSMVILIEFWYANYHRIFVRNCCQNYITSSSWIHLKGISKNGAFCASISRCSSSTCTSKRYRKWLCYCICCTCVSFCFIVFSCFSCLIGIDWSPGSSGLPWSGSMASHTCFSTPWTKTSETSYIVYIIYIVLPNLQHRRQSTITPSPAPGSPWHALGPEWHSARHSARLLLWSHVEP